MVSYDSYLVKAFNLFQENTCCRSQEWGVKQTKKNSFLSDMRLTCCQVMYPRREGVKMCLPAQIPLLSNEDKTGMLHPSQSGCKPLPPLIVNYQINQQRRRLWRRRPLERQLFKNLFQFSVGCSDGNRNDHIGASFHHWINARNANAHNFMSFAYAMSLPRVSFSEEKSACLRIVQSMSEVPLRCQTWYCRLGPWFPPIANMEAPRGNKSINYTFGLLYKHTILGSAVIFRVAPTALSVSLRFASLAPFPQLEAS